MRSPVHPAGLFVWFFGALFGAGACTLVAGLDGEFGLRAADKCSSLSQCNDGNPCTVDTCGADGVCSAQPVNGVPPSQPVGDCQSVNCQAGVPMAQPDDTDSDDGNACTADECSGGAAVHSPIDGAPCLLAGGAEGVCAAGACAMSCKGGDNCDDNNVCTEDVCDIETGLCVNDGSKLQGMLVNDASPGDCEEIRCDTGQVVKVADDDEVPPQDDNDCDIEVCLDGMVVHQNDALDTPCGTNGTLLCDGAGVCMNCINATQCNAADCESPICINSLCGVKDKPAGTACAGGNVCKGEGSCVECIADAQCSLAASEVCDTSTNNCILSCPDTLKDGMETDVDCGGGACPKCANGKACTVNADCISNKCNSGSKLCVP